MAQECEGWNALAQRSPNKVGGFPLGAVNPAARQTLYGSFGLSDCGLVCTAQTGPMASFYLPSPRYLGRPSPSLLENKKLAVKTWPLVRVHSVRVDINHSFMEVSVRVYETCVLLVFLFLTQITEQYLDVVTTEEQEVRGDEGGAGFPIISDSDESPRQWARRSLWLVVERAGGLIRGRSWGLYFVEANKHFSSAFMLLLDCDILVKLKSFNYKRSAWFCFKERENRKNFMDALQHCRIYNMKFTRSSHA